MADRALAFQTQIIPASKVPNDPVRCPNCDSPNLLLYGKVVYPARLTIVDGKESDQSVDLSAKNNFEVDVIECLKCSVRTEIQPDAENILYMENSVLRDEITRLTGKDPYGESKC
jgi:hypothetical protein